MISSATGRRDSDFTRFNHDSRTIHFIEWILLSCLLGLFVAHSFVPAWRSLNSDFPNYYLAALLHRRGIPLDRVYEWTWFQRQNDHLGVRDGVVGFAPNPPAAVLPALPLARFSPLNAKRAWLILNLLFLVLSMWAMHRRTALGWRRLFLLSLSCVVPLHTNFLLGQYYVLILLLLCTAFFAHHSGHRLTSGVLLGVAAALKLFPVVFLALFVRKRNWRSVVGMILGAAALAAISIGILGLEVHRVFLSEVLPQISRGDWLAPYDLQRNSFITVWSHLFLYEPELNPAPLMAAPVVYALAQAITVTALLFGFLLSIRKGGSERSSELEWSAVVVLALLLSSTTGTYHPTLLIFTAIVAVDALIAAAAEGKALILLLLFFAIACAPIPASISRFLPPVRLLAMTAMFVLLLHLLFEKQQVNLWRWVPAALVVGALLTISNLHSVVDRPEDYERRLISPWAGYRSANPVSVSGGIAFTEMMQKRYDAVVLRAGQVQNVAEDGDILSLSGTSAMPFLYFELAARQSLILRLPLGMLASPGETLMEGQEPAISPDGKWFAFIREDRGQRTAWLVATDSSDIPQLAMQDSYHPLEINVTVKGDLIASIGQASDPHLVLMRRATGTVEAIPGVSGPARYPSISPNGEWLAYSRRDRGFWHLIVRELVTGSEQQLTRGACHATSPSWQDNLTLLYATDCGRAIGLSAIAQVSISR